MIYKDFYSEVGKLLYAVADIDGVITQTEKKALQDIVKKELIPADKHSDSFGTESAFYSEIEFDFLDDQIADAEAAFESFIDFVEEHHTAFDQKLRKICIHIANELASAYHGTNKKEKALIEKLKKSLTEIKSIK
jgi:uncharacterized tellurite resistance protein B-like protein